LLTSAASRIRPSAQAGNGSAASDRRSRAICIPDGQTAGEDRFWINLGSNHHP
jgi:hypothetical protein